jgi:hypothetical protein
MAHVCAEKRCGDCPLIDFDIGEQQCHRDGLQFTHAQVAPRRLLR